MFDVKLESRVHCGTTPCNLVIAMQCLCKDSLEHSFGVGCGVVPNSLGLFSEEQFRMCRRELFWLRLSHSKKARSWWNLLSKHNFLKLEHDTVAWRRVSQCMLDGSLGRTHQCPFNAAGSPSVTVWLVLLRGIVPASLCGPR